MRHRAPVNQSAGQVGDPHPVRRKPFMTRTLAGQLLSDFDARGNAIAGGVPVPCRISSEIEVRAELSSLAEFPKYPPGSFDVAVTDLLFGSGQVSGQAGPAGHQHTVRGVLP